MLGTNVLLHLNPNPNLNPNSNLNPKPNPNPVQKCLSIILFIVSRTLFSTEKAYTDIFHYSAINGVGNIYGKYMYILLTFQVNKAVDQCSMLCSLVNNLSLYKLKLVCLTLYQSLMHACVFFNFVVINPFPRRGSPLTSKIGCR